jgi:hypothetical protein
MTTAADVLAGKAAWGVDCSDALAWLRTLPDRCVSLVLFSPPYEDARTYAVDFDLRGQAWVDWLRPIVAEAARVSDGLVCLNAAGERENWSYSPVVEWLVSDLTRFDGVVCGPAPWCWWKVCGIPGSGSTRYQRRDWEPVYGFCRRDRLPLKWTDNTAFGTPPVCGPGGEMSNRTKDGDRVNDPWKTASRGGSGCGGRRKDGEKQVGPKGRRHTKRVPAGEADVMREQNYNPPAVANPGNVIRDEELPDSSVIEARVGGGHLGHPLAHKSEAPMSLTVAERFVLWYCPPDGVVCDPFVGSGTTCHAAVVHGRRFVGCDIRESQAELTARRMSTVTPSLFPGD